MKVLLTGANGFVGSHILDCLIARNIDTAILLRPSSVRRFAHPPGTRVEIRPGSLGDEASLRVALRDVTHVIHGAGCVKALTEKEFFTVNQLGTRAVVQAIAEQGGRVQQLIHISSLAAGGPAAATRPAREDDPPRPVSVYGRSKLAGEAEAGKFPGAWTILRPPAVYGPRDGDFLRLFKAAQAHLLPSFDGGRQTLSFAYVRDLAGVMVDCLNRPAVARRIYHVAGDEVITAHALAKSIAGLIGTWTVPVPLPGLLLWPVCAIQDVVSGLRRQPSVVSLRKYPELRAPGWVCDVTRLRTEAGLECRTKLAEGLAETLAWYRREGWL